MRDESYGERAERRRREEQEAAKADRAFEKIVSPVQDAQERVAEEITTGLEGLWEGQLNLSGRRRGRRNGGTRHNPHPPGTFAAREWDLREMGIS
jgi:hypothetical protein